MFNIWSKSRNLGYFNWIGTIYLILIYGSSSYVWIRPLYNLIILILWSKTLFLYLQTLIIKFSNFSRHTGAWKKTKVMLTHEVITHKPYFLRLILISRVGGSFWVELLISFNLKKIMNNLKNIDFINSLNPY